MWDLPDSQLRPPRFSGLGHYFSAYWVMFVAFLTLLCDIHHRAPLSQRKKLTPKKAPMQKKERDVLEVLKFKLDTVGILA
jgi:hypothetical protein